MGYRDDKVSCLICKHGEPKNAPPDWRPRYRGEKFTRLDVANVIKRTGLHQPMLCALYPVWQDVISNHRCGQFDNDTRCQSVEEYIWGNWNHREIDQLHEQIKELKRQLVEARKISAKRLARLKGAASGGGLA